MDPGTATIWKADLSAWGVTAPPRFVGLRGPGGAFGPPMSAKVGQPLTLTVFHCGMCFVQYSIVSITSLTLGPGGKTYSFCA